MSHKQTQTTTNGQQVKMQVVTARVPPSLLKQMQDEADQKNMYISELVREVFVRRYKRQRAATKKP